MNLLESPWIVGIGGGIISGLLVTVITRYLFSSRDRKEYRQRVATANNEIMYAVRPLIAEKKLPGYHIFDSMLAATARKYGLEVSEVYGVHTLADDLISEIMGNSFLSCSQKLDFCEFVSELKREELEINMRRLHSSSGSHNVYPNGLGRAKDLSAILGTATGLATVFVTVSTMGHPASGELGLGNYNWIYGFAVITSTPILLTVLVNQLARRYRRKTTNRGRAVEGEGWLESDMPKESDEIGHSSK